MGLTDPFDPPLPLQARGALSDELQSILVDLLDLALAGKQLQWVVTGARASSLAETLDELVAEWRRAADIVAGCIRELGRLPNGQARAIAVETRHEPVPTRRVTDAEAAYELAARIRETVAHVALAGKVARPLDPDSARLLEQLRGELAQQAAKVAGAT